MRYIMGAFTFEMSSDNRRARTLAMCQGKWANWIQLCLNLMISISRVDPCCSSWVEFELLVLEHSNCCFKGTCTILVRFGPVKYNNEQAQVDLTKHGFSPIESDIARGIFGS